MDLSKFKIENTILFFANKSDKKVINRLKLMKLIWLSDRLHLNKFGRTITKDSYSALPHGPVASNALTMSNNTTDTFKVVKYVIQAKKEFNPDFFSKSDIEIMNYVWDKFGHYEDFELRDFSHKFKEWKRFESDLNNVALPNSYPMNFFDFFEEIEDADFSDLYDEEMKEYSKSLFNIHSTIQNEFKR
jgi:uncharacterized phage-associated protein